MSTQLVLYPQYYDGYNDISVPILNEYIVNGIDFIALSSTTLHNTTAGYPSEDAIINSPPSIINTWYRYTTTGGSWGTVVAPSVSAGRLWLWFNGGTNGHTGVYQQMSSLSVGLSYDITINLQVAAASGIVALEIWTGTVLQSNFIFSSNVTQITATFTANSPNDIFLIDYEGTATILYIDDISITESSQNPSALTDVEDGQVICDLYQEEDIPLTLSVDEFKNVAEKVQSYSKDFNLPATKRNNQIFDSVFEITRTDMGGINFNPYVKTKCVLKQDGYVLFDGYLRLINIKDNKGEISYDVNLYSEVVALADILKDKTFIDLSFSELDHSYTMDNIKDSWVNTTGITLTNSLASTDSYAYSSAIGNLTNTNVLKYPFVDWTGNIYISDGTLGTIDYPELPSLESAFRPFISVKYIINKIFAETPFTWTSDFFDSSFFANLFMDFNWGEGSAPVFFNDTAQGNRYSSPQTIGTSFTTLEYTGTVFMTLTTTPSVGYSAGVFTASQNNQLYNIVYDFRIEWSGGSTLEIEWVWKDSGGNIIQQINQHTITLSALFDNYSGSFTRYLASGDTLECRAKRNLNSLTYNGTIGIPDITVTTSVNETTSESLLDTLRGGLGQWDFLKGLMTMFNLISMPDPDNPNNILIEPYSDVFITNTAGTNLAARSIQHDWTNKVDVSEMELRPLTDLNKKTIFKYTEDNDDYLFDYYKKSTSGFLYGSLEWDASGFTILEGTDEIIAEPFAATIPKPLFDNLPRIVQINDKELLDGGATYYVPAQNGVAAINEDEFLQCSHLSEIPVGTTTEDINFGVCQYINPLGPAPVDNLFSTYWQPYFNELYNSDTRTMTMKVNLTPADINTFKFQDKVMIKNRIFRVNKINYKPNDLATVEFILIP